MHRVHATRPSTFHSTVKLLVDSCAVEQLPVADMQVVWWRFWCG